MQTVTDMVLPYLPIEGAGMAEDPLAYLDEAKRQHPWLARCGVGFVVHEYRAIRDLLGMNAEFGTSNDAIIDYLGVRGTPWGLFMENMMISHSGPRHLRLREVLAPAFTPRAIGEMRPLMRDVISRLLDDWAPKGSFDFAQFASYFPITVMCGVIGASPDLIDGIRKELEVQGQGYSLDRSLIPALESGLQVLLDFAGDLITARQRDPGASTTDLLGTLAAANSAGRISDVEVRELLILLFVAGYDTSKNMLTLTINMMIDHPDYWTHCAEDRAFCTRVVEEMLRHTSVTMPVRTAEVDAVYRDILFPKGTLLLLTANLSGRDEDAFENAGAFNPERTDANRHVAFGRGVHMCVGQHLARIQIEEAVHLIAQRIRKPQRVGKPTWRRFVGGWGMRTLPIAFEQEDLAQSRVDATVA